MSDFVAGFSPRHSATAELLQQAFAPPLGFAPADPRVRAGQPRSFSPADPGANPTAGWDPFDANAKPYQDPVAAAHTAGYAEGLAAAAADEARDRAFADAIAMTLSTRVDRAEVAKQLRQTVLFLVAKIVGESGVAPDILAGRIEAATDLLTDTAESALLRVHPDDVVLLEGRLPASLFAVGDAAVARGSFVLESASTIVEDGPELWLDQLAAAIDRVAVPAGDC
ncbi:MAG: FliH/SctL family protein [Pseudomonadota bacterium]